MNAATEPFDAIVLPGAPRGGGARTRPGCWWTDRRLWTGCSTRWRPRHRVVVGDERPVSQPVVWAREQPPGSGPAAGVAAALTTTALRQAAARRRSWADAAMHELLAPLDPAPVPACGDEARDLDQSEDRRPPVARRKSRHDTSSGAQ